LRDRHRGPLLLIVECRHRADEKDPFRSATVVESAKTAIAKASGVELLVAAHPTQSGDEDQPSPFTRAVVEALDDADEATGLTVRALYEGMRDSGRLVGAVPSFTYVRGASVFQLIPPSPSAAAKARSAAPSDVAPPPADAAPAAAAPAAAPKQPATKS